MTELDFAEFDDPPLLLLEITVKVNVPGDNPVMIIGLADSVAVAVPEEGTIV